TVPGQAAVSDRPAPPGPLPAGASAPRPLAGGGPAGPRPCCGPFGECRSPAKYHGLLLRTALGFPFWRGHPPGVARPRRRGPDHARVGRGRGGAAETALPRGRPVPPGGRISRDPPAAPPHLRRPGRRDLGELLDRQCY